MAEGPGWSAPARTSDWWRPTSRLATWITWLLVVQAVGSLVAPLLEDQTHRIVQVRRALDASLDGHEQQADRILREANQSSSAWSVIGFATIAALVLVIIWMWRSAHNAQALGRTSPRLTPGWAIGAWFVPIANVVLVYLLYSDLWRSSDPDSAPGDGWRSLPGSALVRVFWLTYVAAVTLTVGTPALGVTGAIGESSIRTLLTIAGAVTAAATLLNIVVVREITARQHALQERDPAPTEPRPLAARTAAPPVVPEAPGWYADPSGRFDHRYWDGAAWTEHVSRAGVVDTAPVAPADWYPDPTGRFRWRYWTGHDWTEHVSRDGDLFLDPVDGDAAGRPPAP